MNNQVIPEADMKRNYLIAAIALFALGVVGGVLNAIDASVVGSIGQLLGYCGAGYYFSRYQAAK